MVGNIDRFEIWPSPIAIKATNQQCGHYQPRKLIVPFGQADAEDGPLIGHQTVTIRRSSSTPFSHHYFVFILNDRLRIVQSINSPTGWLYLALLHAMTSHPQPDQYTEMTGMERAFQLLKSAGCWTDQSFDLLSLDILRQIALISPQVNYYPEHFTYMINIHWNFHSIPYSLQHFGYYLIVKKLVHTSQLLNFMHPSSIADKMSKQTKIDENNGRLLEKLYWDYRDSYNPTARLSPEMEEEILSTNATTRYQPTSQQSPSDTNYPCVHLVDDMYNNGDVRLKDTSEIFWFPLSRWLTDEYELKTVWIGLLKLANSVKIAAAGNSSDDIQRFELLLDFLHYSAAKCHIQSFYLQMLKTVLKVPTLSLISVTFPPFIQYNNIQDISVRGECITFPWGLTLEEQNQIVEEVEHCFRVGSTYCGNLGTSYHNIWINDLLASWQLNKNLRWFLCDIQKHICSFTLIPLNTRVEIYSQQFTFESSGDHHEIKLKSTDKQIDQELLHSAQQKYFHQNLDYFIKPTVSHETIHPYEEFPHEIFPSDNNQENPLTNIANYFKNHLADSWNKLLLTKIYRKEYPSNEEVSKFLDSFRQESAQFWRALVESITFSNDQLFQTGLTPRTTPTILISFFQKIWLNEEQQPFISDSNVLSLRKNVKSENLFLTKDQRILLGGTMVNWIVEQQIERALHFINHDKRDEFERELSNIPHSNWTPSEHLPWLILELELNITIRENQVDVARHMMQPKMSIDDMTVRNIVMQMNMGEGKTSVIIPMLALSLCSPLSSLVRVVVLRSLFPMNRQLLRFILGGLLNRRIFPFACRRDMNVDHSQINKIFSRLKQGLANCDVVLISPEDILAFDLLTIDKCRQNEYTTGRSMLTVQRWLKKFARDVLDESDEILHVKYQLIYTVGGQQQVDGGMERWKTIQTILNLVKRYAADTAQSDHDEICYKSPERKSSFPEFCLLSHQPFPKLCEKIANAWLNQKLYRQADKQCILSFVLDINSAVDSLVDRFSFNDIQLFLIVRGLLSAEVLFVAFNKRYRVNYGVNHDSNFNRLIAVPFRAKDVAADKTEFGHPDVALVLTQLSYYYSGLNDSQMLQCFNHLSQKEKDPESIYDEWISQEDGNNNDSNIKEWKGVNLEDYKQRTGLFHTLRYNMLVINYFLSNFVFPQEAKQFPHKLVSSAWDLSSSTRSHIITGFSGTNDTQLLLPVHICQYDLPELQKTDAIVVNNLLQPENEYYQCLPINATSKEILNDIVNYKSIINVILDVGALFIDGTNSEIAVKWLNVSNKAQIDYVVYLESDSIVVCDRQFHRQSFLTSPASERLDRCVIYLDEVHTRGTDFKFPTGFKAAVTLGTGLTKDRFVQACMRMRKLGKGHSLIFWSSDEVHRQIVSLKKESPRRNTTMEMNNKNVTIKLKDILCWVYENTQQSTWDGLHHWASQSLSFQRKVNAFHSIEWQNYHQEFTNSIMEKLARECLEPEITELKRMYGPPKELQTLTEIYLARYERSHYFCSSALIHNAVLKRLREYGGSKLRLSQLLDEEQQRELEQELEEERQLERPSSVHPCEPILHDEIKRLCDLHDPMLNLFQLPLVFHPLVYAFTGTTFTNDCQPNSWPQNFWISTEFQRVIQAEGESLDSLLRPPRWIVVYRNKNIIFVSAFEANWLIGRLYSLYHEQKSDNPSITTLRLLLPRTKRAQSIFINTPTLTIPPSIAPSTHSVAFIISDEDLAKLFVFNGTLYFETVYEQNAYCQFLGLCPKPRTITEEDAFEKGWIGVDGFVEELEHRRHLQIDRARFDSNPLKFVKQVIENRNNSHASLTSHVGSIILNSLKLI